MDNYESAEFYLNAAKRVREHMIDLEEHDKKNPKKKILTPTQIQHATDAIRNFALLAGAHASLATIDELRYRDRRG